MGNAISDIARDTSALFTGGTSGVNVAQGKAPTEQTLMTDASGLAAGAGLAGAGLGGAAGEAATSASPQGLNAGLIGQGTEPGISTAYGSGGVGLNSATGGAAFNQGLSPGMQALLAGGNNVIGALNAGGSFAPGGFTGTGAQGAGSVSEGGATGGAANVARSATPAAGGGSATAVTGTGAGSQGGSAIDQILKGMRNNAGLAQLGLAGASLAMAGGRKSIPNEGQLNDLAASGSQAAKDLIASYRTGQLSAAQQAGLDQLTQNTKNQINSYFASIGQSDSTAHMQALAQVDQQALGMKQNMLDNMLQQGLQAIGVASGPLQTVANYQIAQDKNLTDAFGNFANAVGNAFGREAGTQAPPPPKSGQAGTGSGVGTKTQSFDR